MILGPSGSGKGTCINYLHEKFPDAVFPLSCTTRPARTCERDGDVYHFLSAPDFEKKRERGEFLEWAIVHHNYIYGTLKQPILNALSQGKIVIREVDMQGVRSIRQIIPREQVVSIFITAPSWENLKKRILKRSKIPDDELREREKSFEREIKFSRECDFVVMSEEGRIDEFCREVADIIKRNKS